MGSTERIRSPMDMIHVEGEIPVNYLYTAGVAGERFLREIKENAKILGIKCRRCNTVHVPPKVYCERCFERLDEWVELTGEGQVEAFTTCHFDPDGSRLAEPEILAAIRLRGANESIVHRIKEVHAEGVYIGMKVKAAFKEKKDRVGSILDIDHFKPWAP